ncbi:hypothetical protein ABPG75_011531 [Micractinium tetrahymenae]
MGSNWHRKEERSRKEWVVFVAAGIVLLLVAGAVALGVLLGARKGGGSDAAQQAAAVQSGPSAPAAIAGPPPPVLQPPAAIPPIKLSLSPPAAVPAPVASPPPAAAATASPPPAAPPPAAPVQVPATPAGSPPPAAAVPSPPAASTSPSPSTSKSTYDPSLVAKGTLDGAPDGQSSPSYDPPPVEEDKKGTCEFNPGRELRCRDDMDYGATAVLPVESFQIMHDPEMMEGCGFADLTQIVNGLIKWAYKGKCGVSHYTPARACVGKEGEADGYWRARVMLWPLPGGDPEVCVPLCIKMRGFQNEVTDYGRTGGC